MRIFEFNNYKEFVTIRIESLPQKGYGQYRKMAAHLNISSVQVSQVFRGSRHLSDDQAIDLCEFLELSAAETDYFLVLVQKERAGTHRAQTFYQQKLRKMKDEALATKNRIRKDIELTENIQAVYYSYWYYSAIRLCCMNPNLNTIPRLAKRLQLPEGLVEDAVRFLLSANLLKRQKGNQFVPTQEHIFIDNNSPFIRRHHSNWRSKAIENMVGVDSHSEMFFTCPLTVSLPVAGELRNRFRDVIEEMMQAIQKPAEGEELYCLSIDWFQVRR